ncbi:MAG: MerR family transcriptional regulator [Acidimicrobiales bacterium]
MNIDRIPIGRFSQMSRLSIKALRLYADQGLLVPAWIDPATGYRYYRSGQANQAEAIRILRAVDMPLDEIRELLAADGPDAVIKQLAVHRERLEARLDDQARMLRFLQRLINQGGTVMPYDVTIKSVPPQRVASWRTRTDLSRIGDDIGRGFAAVVGALTEHGVQPVGNPFIVYHDVIDEQTDGTIEVCIPTPDGVGDQRPVGDVEWNEIAGATVASTTHRGPYDEIAPAYHTVTGWIEEHGHRMQGPPRELYLNDPQTVIAEDLLTEVQFPIAPG